MKPASSSPEVSHWRYPSPLPGRAVMIHAAGWAGLGALLIGWAAGHSPLEVFRIAYHTLIPLSIREAVWPLGVVTLECLGKAKAAFLNPLNYALVVGVFALEARFPARPRQKVLSMSLVQDFLWLNANAYFKMVWLAGYLGFLYSIYDRHLSWLSMPGLAAWPSWLRWAVSFLFFDFLNWFHHWIRHKVEVFWYFHMVHHAQRELNLFTDARVHFAEFIVTKAVLFIPMHALQIDLNTVFWLSVVMDWYTQVYHGNIRSNYGIFKHILVTPQSHRIHHSMERAHWNKNFGLFLTVWDRLFGTLHARYDEYPETGVDDPRFPDDSMALGLGVFLAFFAQLVYPFRLVWERAAGLAGARMGARP